MTPRTATRRERADALGREHAARTVDRYGTREPRRIAQAAGVTVRTDEWGGLSSLALLGTYADGTVTLYTRQIAAAAAAVDVSESLATELVLAHELAHHTFAVDPPTFGETEQSGCRRWLSALLPGRRDGLSRDLEEVAAHAFVATLVPESTGEALDALRTYCPQTDPSIRYSE
ncbi:hypothetical protein [Haloprofundus salilacus]|uniref:hypothetical protein n=1 Tax=Haloprofundus salilacus TaxID=2876190 RepID=UPI001CCBBE07|nr:hypothetical protein [Haloprofundus salilacus]